MIYIGSLIKIVDNSGGKFGRCIKLYTGSNKKGALVGDQILITMRKINYQKKSLKIKKGGLYRSLIVRTTKELCRKDGTVVKMSNNASVLIQVNGNPISSRIKGPIFKEVRDLQFIKVASISQGLI